jgi:hypothetical protein
VAEELARCAVVILAEIEAPSEWQTQKAWRLAIEEWLLKNGQIKEENQDVLPSCQIKKFS